MGSTDDQPAPAPNKRQQWFIAGARVVAAAVPDLPAGDWYACPLCEDFLSIDEFESKELTLEHVPPESLGGRELVLTCKSCNNRSGHTVDHHMRRSEALRRFGSSDPLSQLDVTLTTIDGIPIRGSMQANCEEVLFEGNPKQNDPKDVARFIESFEDLANAGKRMNVAFRERPNLRSAQLGFLRAAYLTAFAVFGYAYVFRPSLDSVRGAISGNDDGTLVPPVLIRDGGSPSDRQVGAISEPNWLAGALVVVIGQVAVILPNVHGAGDPIAELMARRTKSPGDLVVQFTLSHVFGWPSAPQHMLDDWLVSERKHSSDS